VRSELIIVTSAQKFSHSQMCDLIIHGFFSIFELFSASPLCVVLAASWFCTLTKVGVLW